MSADRIFEIAGLLIGLLYLYWEYRADWRMWIASVVMPAISLFVYWRAGLYADFGIDIYYLLIAIYGYYVWQRKTRRVATTDATRGNDECHTSHLPISRTPSRMWPVLAVSFAAIYLGIAYVLLRFTDSTVPWWDALNTALSIVAMWMLARKWVEQWLVWLVVDAVSTALYIYKGIPFYAVLYALYTVIAWFGYRRWLREMGKDIGPLD